MRLNVEQRRQTPCTGAPGFVKASSRGLLAGSGCVPGGPSAKGSALIEDVQRVSVLKIARWGWREIGHRQTTCLEQNPQPSRCALVASLGDRGSRTGGRAVPPEHERGASKTCHQLATRICVHHDAPRCCAERECCWVNGVVQRRNKTFGGWRQQNAWGLAAVGTRTRESPQDRGENHRLLKPVAMAGQTVVGANRSTSSALHQSAHQPWPRQKQVDIRCKRNVRVWLILRAGVAAHFGHFTAKLQGPARGGCRPDVRGPLIFSRERPGIAGAGAATCRPPSRRAETGFGMVRTSRRRRQKRSTAKSNQWPGVTGGLVGRG